MDEEPTTAEPKMPRGPFPFRLRTLLIVVVVASMWCASTVWFVYDRERLIRERDEAWQEASELRDKAMTAENEVRQSRRATLNAENGAQQSERQMQIEKGVAEEQYIQLLQRSRLTPRH